jgi:hypothetical protein
MRAPCQPFLRTAAVVVLGFIAIAGCAGGDDDPGAAAARNAPAATASTPAVTRVTGATVQALLLEATSRVASLPVTYDGNASPGGGNQTEVGAQFSLVAADLQAISDRVREVDAGDSTSDVDATADALRAQASTVAAIGECVAQGDPNVAGTRFVADICGSPSAAGHAHNH